MIVNYQAALWALQNGELLGIPTETVYGLAGRIDQEGAIRQIFELKERPFFDPLIVHVSDIESAKRLSHKWSNLAQVLAEKFWPGPLTLVLPKTNAVSDLITSGLASVGIRMPNQGDTLKLISELGVPLAAPSANKFGKTSPTSALHVEREFAGSSLKILDGGACQVGIESTVLVISGDQLQILRAGSITKSQIKSVLSGEKAKFEFVENLDPKAAPGQLKHHYMPAKPLVFVQSQILDSEILAKMRLKLSQAPDEVEGVKIVKPLRLETFSELRLNYDAKIAARELYAQLRICSEAEGDFIIFRMNPVFSGEVWEAILDRLRKAASVLI